MKHKSYRNFQVPAFSSVLQEKKKTTPNLPWLCQAALGKPKGVGDAGGKGKNDTREVSQVSGQEIRILSSRTSWFSCFLPPFPYFQHMKHVKREHLDVPSLCLDTAIFWVEKMREILHPLIHWAAGKKEKSHPLAADKHRSKERWVKSLSCSIPEPDRERETALLTSHRFKSLRLNPN